MKISIAMTTYNGEKYCLEQLESLVDQKHKPCEIVIGDDGSQDRTIEIIEEFSKKIDIPIKLIRNSPGLGFAKNFFNVFMNCAGDWICFCDQDDVWFPNKIQKAVEVIHQKPDVNVIFQNSYICSYDLEVRGRKFPDRFSAGSYTKKSLPGIWIWPGFLQTIKRQPFQSFLKAHCDKNGQLDTCSWKSMAAHDYWISVIANAIGGVEVLSEPVALYRRHDNAVTGAFENIGIKERLNISKKTGSDQYTRNSIIANDNSAYMKWLADKQSDVELTHDLFLAASKYERLARFYSVRSNIYSSRSMKQRIFYYIKALTINGYYYSTRSFYQSLKSAAKDFGVVFKIFK